MEDTIKIFYSHSQTDKVYLEKFRTHLAVARNNNLISDWSDDDIKAGTAWFPSIKTAVESCDIVVFLISSKFFDTPFILNNEVKPLLERREKEDGVEIYSIILRASEFNETPLSKYQARPQHLKPIASLDESEQDEQFNLIAKEIRELAIKIREKKKITARKEYKNRVEKYKWNDGDINDTEIDALYVLQKKLKLDDGEAKDIKNEVENEYELCQSIIRKYDSAFNNAVSRQFPLSQTDLEALEDIKADFVFSDNVYARQKFEDTVENFISLKTLKDMLQAQKWKSAAYLTQKLMYKEAGRKTENWLRKEDIDKLTESFLPQVDQLWMEYSNGHFGFSIQKEIYLNIGGLPWYIESAWNHFNDVVGWRKNGNFLKFNELSFSLDNRGQLPYPPHYKYDNLQGYIASLIFNINNLDQTLQHKQWRTASLITIFLVLQAAGRGKSDFETYLKEEDLQKFSIETLKKIDRLWVKHSDGHFGFSIQAEIYKKLNGDKHWDVFFKTIGWHDNGKTDSFDKLDFSLNAPKGELPFTPGCDHSDSKPYIAFLAEISWN